MLRLILLLFFQCTLPLLLTAAPSTPSPERQALVHAGTRYLTSLQRTPYAPHFTPPQDWLVGDGDQGVPGGVLCACLEGVSRCKVAPTAFLAAEPFAGSESEYVQCVKEQNRCYHASSVRRMQCKEIPSIQCQAGKAHCLRIEAQGPSGKTTYLQAILTRNGFAYTLTVGGASKEFESYLPTYKAILRSLSVNPSPIEMLSEDCRSKIAEAEGELKEALHLFLADSSEPASFKLSQNQEFQNSHWRPFCDSTAQTTKDLGQEWLNLYLTEVANRLDYLSRDLAKNQLVCDTRGEVS